MVSRQFITSNEKSSDWCIIKQFSRRNIYGFSFKDVAVEFPEKNPVHLARILADMVDMSMLYKIARNVYHIIPLNEDPESYVPDKYQMAKYIMLNKEY
jgi:predicted transcriptional regulator of viral defense system